VNELVVILIDITYTPEEVPFDPNHALKAYYQRL